MKRIICWFFGHKPWKDPIWHPFSTRNGICSRCGKYPPRVSLPNGRVVDFEETSR